MTEAPSLEGLTFEVDRRREWTPPAMDSLEHKLWDSPRTSAAYLNANPYRPGNQAKAVRTSVGPDHSKGQPQPQAQHQTQPQPQLQTHQQEHSAPAQPGVAAEPSRVVTPRRASPVRIICAEPSLSQLPTSSPAELPSVRGQTAVLAAPPARDSTHHRFSNAGNVAHSHSHNLTSVSSVGPAGAATTAAAAGGVGGSAAASASASASAAPAAAATVSGSTGGGGHLSRRSLAAAPVAAGAALPSDPGGTGTAAGGGGLGAGPGPGGGGGGGGGSLLDHMSAMASSHQPSGPDPVEAYLARYQLHQYINDNFRVRQDEHLRTVQELGARIQAMTRIPASPPKKTRSKREAAGKQRGGGAAAAAAAAAGKGGSGGAEGAEGKAAGEEGRKAGDEGKAEQAKNPKGAKEAELAAAAQAAAGGPATSSTTTAAAAAAAAGEDSLAPSVEASAAATGDGAGAAAAGGPDPDPSPAAGAAAAPGASASPPGPASRPSVRLSSPPGAIQLPDPPLGRNRFAPTLSSVSASKRPASAPGDSPASPPSALPTPPSPRSMPVLRPLPEGPPAGVSALQELQLQHQLLQNQGAYLALPDGSFAGSLPFRAVPTQEGLLFEKYGRKGKAAGDLPALQLRYLRPPTVAPKEPRHLKRIPRQPQPPARALPNGIPASRLERLSARRRNRSPPRGYQQTLQQLQQGPPSAELVQLNGAVVSPSGPAMAATGDGLLRSPSLLAPGHPARNLRPGQRAASAPDGGTAGGSGGTSASGEGTLAQYLAVATAPSSGEPLLDDNFFDVLQQHFRSNLHRETAQLRAALNVSLPNVLGALNCVNVTEPLPPPSSFLPGQGRGRSGAGSVAGSASVSVSGSFSRPQSRAGEAVGKLAR